METWCRRTSGKMFRHKSVLALAGVVCVIVAACAWYAGSLHSRSQLNGCLSDREEFVEQTRMLISYKEKYESNLAEMMNKSAASAAELENKQNDLKQIIQDKIIADRNMEALQINCNRVKDDMNNILSEFNRCKNKHTEISYRYQLLKDEMKARELRTTEMLQQQGIQLPKMNHPFPANISRFIALQKLNASGVYNIEFTGSLQPPQPTTNKPAPTEQTKPKNQIPHGVAPELFVDDQNDKAAKIPDVPALQKEPSRTGDEPAKQPDNLDNMESFIVQDALDQSNEGGGAADEEQVVPNPDKIDNDDDYDYQKMAARNGN